MQYAQTATQTAIQTQAMIEGHATTFALEALHMPYGQHGLQTAKQNSTNDKLNRGGVRAGASGICVHRAGSHGMGKFPYRNMLTAWSQYSEYGEQGMMDGNGGLAEMGSGPPKV